LPPIPSGFPFLVKLLLLCISPLGLCLSFFADLQGNPASPTPITTVAYWVHVGVLLEQLPEGTRSSCLGLVEVVKGREKDWDGSAFNM
jgi:hypothetical protein